MYVIDWFGRKFRNGKAEELQNNSEDPNFGTDAGDWCEEGPGATLVTSLLADQSASAFDILHAPVIDIDLPCHYVPSTTPGHGHLYINKAMRWQDVRKLLDVLVEVGIVERGYRDASAVRGYTAVRTPWTYKPGA